jgi:pimeloyl-ACP methyl ester carboxylesterase
MPDPDNQPEPAHEPPREFTQLAIAPFERGDAPAGTLRVDYTSGMDGLEDWALIIPPREGQVWLGFLHGHGSGGDQLLVRKDIREWLLYPALERGLGLLMCNLRGNAWMGPAAVEDLRSLIVLARGQYGAEKLLFASGSMGATSNLIFARLHPEEVAGLVALCPATDLASYWEWCQQKASPITLEIAGAIQQSYGGTPTELPALYEAHSALAGAQRLKMPLLLAHGTADDIIPVEQSRRLAEQLAEAEHFTYLELDGGHHDSPLAIATEALEEILVEVLAG